MTTRDLQQYVTSGGATSLRTGDGGSAAQIGGKKNQQSKKRITAIPCPEGQATAALLSK
jgi:hypothetical protein